jgi:hypothetical protein
MTYPFDQMPFHQFLASYPKGVAVKQPSRVRSYFPLWLSVDRSMGHATFTKKKKTCVFWLAESFKGVCV